MPYRKVPLVKNELYHIMSKSIAGYTVFNNLNEFDRLFDLMSFYRFENPSCRYSYYREHLAKHNELITSVMGKQNPAIDIIAYCLMPTHIHLLLKGKSDKSISVFMHRILLSYSKYFNKKHKRKGPLWENRFNNVHVKSDQQLLHLTRYIHLNPVTAYLCDVPEYWKYSSYKEYLRTSKTRKNICSFDEHMDIDQSYSDFVNDHIDYQRNLAQIKHLILE